MTGVGMNWNIASMSKDNTACKCKVCLVKFIWTNTGFQMHPKANSGVHNWDWMIQNESGLLATYKCNHVVH